MRLLLIGTTILSLLAGAAMAETAPAAPASHSEKFIPKEEWDKLTPEKRKETLNERRAGKDAKRKEWKAKYDAATPAEQEKMNAERKAEHEANKAKWKERYDAASPEEKKKMEAKVEKRRERRAEWRKNHPKPDTAPAPKS